MSPKLLRRDFIGAMSAGLIGSASAGAQTRAATAPEKGDYFLPEYACAQNYQSLKQSSYDRTGGNKDYRVIKAGETIEVFKAGLPTHGLEKRGSGKPPDRHQQILRRPIECRKARIRGQFCALPRIDGLERTILQTRWRGESHSNP